MIHNLTLLYGIQANMYQLASVLGYTKQENLQSSKGDTLVLIYLAITSLYGICSEQEKQSSTKSSIT